jgi:small subunit ribosomal protein S4e
MTDKETVIKVDGVKRSDKGFPLGVMDVLHIEKSNETYRIMYDSRGRFVLKSLKKDE